MDGLADQIEALRLSVLATGVSRRRIAVELGLSRDGLRGLEKPGWVPRGTTLRKLQAWLAARPAGVPEAA